MQADARRRGVTLSGDLVKPDPRQRSFTLKIGQTLLLADRAATVSFT